MNLHYLSKKYSRTREQRIKSIFSSLFILQNKLQTVFDNDKKELTLKQFMLLTLIRQYEKELTLTELGKLLGCSRQNIKKLAISLKKKGFVTIEVSTADVRAYAIRSTPVMDDYVLKISNYYDDMLTFLFKDYSDDEITQLFSSLTRLYAYVDKLEAKLRELDELQAEE